MFRLGIGVFKKSLEMKKSIYSVLKTHFIRGKVRGAPRYCGMPHRHGKKYLGNQLRRGTAQIPPKGLALTRRGEKINLKMESF